MPLPHPLRATVKIDTTNTAAKSRYAPGACESAPEKWESGAEANMARSSAFPRTSEEVVCGGQGEEEGGGGGMGAGRGSYYI